MGSALRIAAVTQVLKDLLNNGLIDHDVSDDVQGSITVTSLPPDRIDTAVGKEISQLNLFMYQTTFNQGWRNVAQPAFNHKGERVANPPLAIDLHYLLTAYGALELHTDILLGYGMQILHETMVLGRDAIRKALAPPSMFDAGGLPDALKSLSTSDLAEQIEQITITPEILSIEDISKLWAAFGSKYRPTTAYKVSVVLIESERSTKPGLPVLKRNVYAQPFKEPVIEKILSQAAPGQPILETQKILNTYRLFLQGYQLAHEQAAVLIDGIAQDGAALNMQITATQIAFDLPANITAGMHEIQVAHPAMMGSPEVAHTGVVSKSAIIVVSPQITNTPDGSQTIASGNGLLSGPVTFTISPALQPGQKLTLLLNEVSNNSTAAGYSFKLGNDAFGSPPVPIADISIPISGVKPAKYLLRIRIDQAESPLLTDANGVFNSPILNLA